MLADLGVKIPCSENTCYVIFFFNFNILIIHILNVTRMERFSFFLSRSKSQKEAVKELSMFLIREELLGDK